MLLMASFVAFPASAHRIEFNINNPLNVLATTGVRFDMYGTIGNEHAHMEMNGSTGTFEYAGIKRKLKFSSYNSRTGRLIISEYDLRGKYIGKFNGIYRAYEYHGVFTNTRGGKAEFSLVEFYD